MNMCPFNAVLGGVTKFTNICPLLAAMVTALLFFRCSSVNLLLETYTEISESCSVEHERFYSYIQYIGRSV